MSSVYFKASCRVEIEVRVRGRGSSVPGLPWSVLWLDSLHPGFRDFEAWEVSASKHSLFLFHNTWQVLEKVTVLPRSLYLMWSVERTIMRHAQAALAALAVCSGAASAASPWGALEEVGAKVEAFPFVADRDGDSWRRPGGTDSDGFPWSRRLPCWMALPTASRKAARRASASPAGRPAARKSVAATSQARSRSAWVLGRRRWRRRGSLASVRAKRTRTRSTASRNS